jgi:hypothetical protein
VEEPARLPTPLLSSQQRLRLRFLGESGSGGRLAALRLTIEEEKYFRIDYCQSCLGYLKTYSGEGSEPLFLADWNFGSPRPYRPRSWTETMS